MHLLSPSNRTMSSVGVELHLYNPRTAFAVSDLSFINLLINLFASWYTFLASAPLFFICPIINSIQMIDLFFLRLNF